jgi:excisionase family DNA binding protein
MKTDEVMDRLDEIIKFIRVKDDNPLNFVQAAQYLSISHSQLYKYTSQRKIPFHKPAGKYLYFFKNELDKWICRNDPNPDPLPEGEGIGEQKPDNEPGLFDEEEKETEPP